MTRSAGGSAAGHVGGVEHAHRHARVGEQRAGDPAVGAVVALAGDHVDDAAVGAAEHLRGRRGRRPRRPAR